MANRTKGRGAGFNPDNRFSATALEILDVDPGPDDDGTPALKTTYWRDRSRSILSENDSEDIPFRWSLNPYRGCEHGCVYCYARPGHEYLGFSAGLDFESKIVVKTDAPRLLARVFSSPKWIPDRVCFSGVTDCYQPVERALRLTRGCLEVAAEFGNPVCLITKNALVTRDLDILAPMGRNGIAEVMFSITTLDAGLARRMEPRAATPARRLEALAACAAAGIPAGVSVAPVIPGLTDSELPAILEAARAAGARRASYSILRLPGAVLPLFIDWLRREYPLRAERVVGALRGAREGALSDDRIGKRMKGEGVHADALARLFEITRRKLGLGEERESLRTDLFRRKETQRELF